MCSASMPGLPHLMSFKTVHGVNDTVQVEVVALLLSLPGPGPGPRSRSRAPARFGCWCRGVVVLGVPVQLDAQVDVGNVLGQ